MRPRPGQVVEPMALDRWRDYPADGLTPSQLVTILAGGGRGCDRSGDGAVRADGGEGRAPVLGGEHAPAGADGAALAGGVGGGGGRTAWIGRRRTRRRTYCREVVAGDRRVGMRCCITCALAFGRNIAVAENVWEAAGDELQLADGGAGVVRSIDVR